MTEEFCLNVAPPSGASLPDDIIIVSKVELLGVFSGVVDHTHSSYEVYHLFSCGIVQVVPTLVTSVAVDPLQPQLAAWRRLIRHDGLKLWINVFSVQSGGFVPSIQFI